MTSSQQNIKFMKRKIFMACAALVVSAAAVVGVKAYNYYSMPELMRANLEALSQGEVIGTFDCWMDFDTKGLFVDNSYKTVCRNPKTGEICHQIKGHDFSNHGKCTVN